MLHIQETSSDECLAEGQNSTRANEAAKKHESIFIPAEHCRWMSNPRLKHRESHNCSNYSDEDLKELTASQAGCSRALGNSNMRLNKLSATNDDHQQVSQMRLWEPNQEVNKIDAAEDDDQYSSHMRLWEPSQHTFASKLCTESCTRSSSSSEVSSGVPSCASGRDQSVYSTNTCPVDDLWTDAESFQEAENINVTSRSLLEADNLLAAPSQREVLASAENNSSSISTNQNSSVKQFWNQMCDRINNLLQSAIDESKQLPPQNATHCAEITSHPTISNHPTTNIANQLAAGAVSRDLVSNKSKQKGSESQNIKRTGNGGGDVTQSKLSPPNLFNTNFREKHRKPGSPMVRVFQYCCQFTLLYLVQCSKIAWCTVYNEVY